MPPAGWIAGRLGSTATRLRPPARLPGRPVPTNARSLRYSRMDFAAAARGRTSLYGPGPHSKFRMPRVVRDPKMLAQEQEVPAEISNPPGYHEVFLVIQ
jgi:hypothetical protein